MQTFNPLGIHHAAASQVGDGGNNEGPSGLNYYTNTFDHRAPPSPATRPPVRRLSATDCAQHVGVWAGASQYVLQARW